MIDWIKTIAAQARKKKDTALVIPQNGVQLLTHPDFLETINAIGVEDLFSNGNQRQKKAETLYKLAFLEKIKAAGKPVLLIEYGTKTDTVQNSVTEAEKNVFSLLVTDRELKTLGL